MAAEIPAVSVIIPMYNTEKYIAECLESICAQTLKNFELIVIDNGSTDNSAAIVKSFIPKFEGRLKLLHMKENTGGPSIPRNKGLELSRGKYIYFMDSDDCLIKTALQEMYTIAENFQAEVVHCVNYEFSSAQGKDFFHNIKVYKRYSDTQPALLSEDFNLRLKLYFAMYFDSQPWLKFVRRDFLIENEIKFRRVFREDDLWSFEILFSAKKFLLIPNVCILYRVRKDSITAHADRPLNKKLRYWLDRIINGFELLKGFMEKIPFFRDKPETRYAVFSAWISSDLKLALSFCGNLPMAAVFEIFDNEFKNNLGAKSTLVSCLFANNLDLMKDLILTQQKLTTSPYSKKS